MAIRNLILDLGGVLYGVDVTGGMKALHGTPRQPGANPLPATYDELISHPIFTMLEIGAIGPEEFQDAVRAEFSLVATDDELQALWTSILAGLIPGRTEQVRALSEQYRLALLSNTNRIHYEHFHKECEAMFSYFESCYFSFEMGCRKPDPASYRIVLDERGFNPSETLFADDSAANLRGAEKLGISTFHVRPEAGARFGDLVERMLPDKGTSFN